MHQTGERDGLRRRLHVAFFTDYFWPEIGAPQSRLAYNARFLASQGHRVTVVTTFPNYPEGVVRPAYRGEVFRRERWEGCEILRSWSFTSPDRRMANRLKSFISLDATASGLTLPRLVAPDVMLVECPPLLNAAVGLVWRRLKRAALVLHVSDLEVRALLEWGLIHGMAAWPLKRFQREVLRRADGVVTVSDYCRDDLVEGGADPQDVAVIPNGVDVDHFVPASDRRALRKELGLPLDRTIVVYAGTHGHVHGVEQIVEAARTLRDEPIYFLMIGDGVGKAEAVRRARTYGLENIRFLASQPLDVLPDYLNAADIGLSTLTDRETSHSVIPVKMLTYMACGLPFVSSDRRHCREIVEATDGAGVLVPASDAAALAEAVRRLAARPQDWPRMGERGRAYVVRGWSRRLQAQQLLEVLRHAAARRTRG